MLPELMSEQTALRHKMSRGPSEYTHLYPLGFAKFLAT